MPRPSTGNPHWKALAVKLPEQMIDEVRRYADLHGMSISEVIREGLDMRLHGPQQASEYGGITAIPATTVTVLTRLATTLTTAAEQLRSACAGATLADVEAQHGTLESYISTQNTEYNSNTEYNGNILDRMPHFEPQPVPQEDTQQPDACPPFDPTKYVLGKLCKLGHEWGTTGQSLLSTSSHTCKTCKAASKRRKRAEKRQTTPPQV